MDQDLASVLLIEDNPGDVRLVRERLGERFGSACRVHAAETLDRGLRWLDTGRADVILLDLSLPDSQGLQTYFSVHAHAPATPVVILSGHDDDDLALDAVRAGAEDYLAKQHADGHSLVRTMRHAVERRRGARALRESEARYRTIVETAEEGILQIDDQGRVRFANARMGRMLGRPIEQIADRRFIDLVEPSYIGLARHLLASCAGHSGRRTVDLRFARADGSLLWAMVAAGSIHALGGEARDVVVMLTDITGRVLAEQELVRIARKLEKRVAERTAELEAANAELQTFNHSIAHDLRQPLGHLIGFADLLERSHAGTLTEDALHRVQLIRRGARDMNALVGGLLALSKISRTELRRNALDLSAIALGVLDELRSAEPQRVLEAVVEPGLTARGDAALVRDLLANLIGNAWKYSARAAQPWLRVTSVQASGGETVFGVHDNGVGFDAASADKLFLPFARLPSSAGFEGSGIGLATAKRIVQRHGGRIWAESRPGERTSFYFTLGAEPA